MFAPCKLVQLSDDRWRVSKLRLMCYLPEHADNHEKYGNAYITCDSLFAHACSRVSVRY